MAEEQPEALADVEPRGPMTTLEVSVGGYAKCTLKVGAPQDAQGVGSGGIEVAAEISDDNGQTWRDYSDYSWRPGTKLTSKSEVRGYHYVEERAMSYVHELDANGNEIIVVIPSTFPAAQKFRYVGRYLGPGALQLSVDLENASPAEE